MDAPESQSTNEKEPGPPRRAEGETGIGPVAGVLIIVLLLAVAGVYFFRHEQKRLHTPPVEQQFNA